MREKVVEGRQARVGGDLVRVRAAEQEAGPAGGCPVVGLHRQQQGDGVYLVADQWQKEMSGAPFEVNSKAVGKVRV